MAEGDLQLASRGPLLIVAISAPPSAEVVARVEAELGRLVERHPQGVYIVVVREVPEGKVARRPDHEVRAQVLGLVRRESARLRGLAYVLPRGGFASTVVRTVIDGMLRVAPFPARLFADSSDAMEWLRAKHGLEVEASEVLSALRDVRARIDA
jgi:hypothetical protein